MEAHGGEDGSEEHDGHVGVIGRQGGGRGAFDGRHVERSVVVVVEERIGNEGEPYLFLTPGADVHHPSGGRKGEVGASVWPGFEESRKGELCVPSIIWNDGMVREDGVETDPSAEVEREIDEMAIDERDEVVVIDGKEEMGIDEDGPASLKEMGGVMKVVVVEVAFEGSERNVLKTGGTEIGVVVRVVVGADGAHDGMVDVVLVVGIVCTQVMGNVGDVEGSKIGIGIVVKQGIKIVDVGSGEVLVIGVGVGST